MCRIAGKALSDTFGENFRMLVLHDEEVPVNNYIACKKVRPCRGSLVSFFSNAIFLGRKADTIILSHVNLLPVGWLVKKLFPSKRLILFIHGIEVWDGLKGYRKKMTRYCDRIIAVSRFTADRFSATERFSKDKITVLNNCLDPYLPSPLPPAKEHPVLLTLTRLSATERAKGYDDVIRALRDLREFPGLKYIIAGKYSEDEHERIRNLSNELGVGDRVEMPGFIADDDIPGVFSKATVYVMPSTKEGFGIVFVEAMFYGVPVISSNADGSTDALRDGRFGQMVEPGNQSRLVDAIRNALKEPSKYIAPAGEVLMEFGYENYKRKLLEILKNEQG